MGKTSRFLGGIMTAIAAIFMIGAFFFILQGDMRINQDLIESTADKLFFGMVSVGCGICYGIASICLFTKWNLLEHKIVGIIGILSLFSFVCGWFYCFILQSPW